MDSGSGKSVVTRIIGWLRGLSESASSRSGSKPGQASRRSDTGSASVPGAQRVAPATPAATTETVPRQHPSEQANVPPNAPSLDLSSSGTSSAAPSGTTSTDSEPSNASTEAAPVPSSSGDFDSAAPPSTNDVTAARKIDYADQAESATGSSSLVPPEDAESADALGSTEAEDESEARDVQADAQQANYGRGNLDVGAKASAGRPDDDESLFEAADEAPDAGSPTEAEETSATGAGEDPLPEQPVGMTAADLVAGPNRNLTSVQESLSSYSAPVGIGGDPAAERVPESGQPETSGMDEDSGTSIASDSSSTDDNDTTGTVEDAEQDVGVASLAEQTPDNEYSRAEAFDSVDAVGIFGLADRDPGNLGYLDEASRESFESSVEELPESTGLFGFRESSEPNLDYLSGSETERFDFDATTTSDVSTGEDYDSGQGSPELGEAESPGAGDLSGDTAVASDLATTEVASAPPSSADPETLLAADELQTAITDAETGTGLIDAASSETQLDSTDVPESSEVIPTAEPDGSATDDSILITTPSTRAAAGSEPGPTTSATQGGSRVKGVDGVCPPDHPIKGNASSKVYHVPDLPSYEKTRAEWCFATEEDAISFGYRAPGGHRNRPSGKSGG